MTPAQARALADSCDKAAATANQNIFGIKAVAMLFETAAWVLRDFASWLETEEKKFDSVAAVVRINLTIRHYEEYIKGSGSAHPAVDARAVVRQLKLILGEEV